MEMDPRIAAEHHTLQEVLGFIERDLADTPAAAVAGALMRASVAVAVQVWGRESGHQAARQALDIILSEPTRENLQ